MTEQKNLLVAIGLALLILVGFNYFYEQPRSRAILKQAEQNFKKKEAEHASESKGKTVKEDVVIASRDASLVQTDRVAIRSGKVHGSINLQGARFDDLTLARYHETPDPKSAEITLLSPSNTTKGYFVDCVWTSSDRNITLPDEDSVWETNQDELKAGESVTLTWKNEQGLEFNRTISLDPQYMFTIYDRVKNTSSKSYPLKVGGRVVRKETPQVSGFFILHEGPLAVLNGKLHELDYADLLKDESLKKTAKEGWIGMTDKYWLVSLIPAQKSSFDASVTGAKEKGRDHYTTEFTSNEMTLKPGEEVEYSQHLYAGPKVLSLLDGYEETIGISKFDLAIDFGWFYFLTKPLFYVLDWLFKHLGNFGLAILLMTVLFKLATFPLANKSYHSMARMRTLQPKFERIRAQYANDKMKLNQEMMALYQKEKVNPVSGCLPMFIQAPLFFCLYKVLFVNIEMRHAPFYGWINDLSAPDPTSLFNLFGLIPWDPPSFLMIGVWPLIMGLTMFIQQKLNPQPADPAQAKVFMFMPVMMTFLFAQFPAGLVIYWAWSNILGIIQQWSIMKLDEKRIQSSKRA